MPTRTLLAATLAAAVLALPSAASAAPRLYAAHYNDDAIGGFELGADGAPSPLADNPFVGGDGGLIGMAFGPDGSRAATSFLFFGGAQGLSVAADGSVDLAGPGRASPSATEIAISPDGRFAYTSTREFGGFDGVGIVGYPIAEDGVLNDPDYAPSDSDYTSLAVTPDARFLYASGPDGIDRFAIASDGSLTGPVSASTRAAFKLVVSPDGRFLFASAADAVSYTIASNGALTQNDGAPNTGFGINHLAVSPDGGHIYTSDFNGIATIAVADDGDLSSIAGVPTEGEAGGLVVSPDGRFLYYADMTEQIIGVASIAASGIPTLLEDLSATWDSGTTEAPLRIQPQPAPEARLAAPSMGGGGQVSFDAGESVTAARYDWDFGDGTKLANGGPSPIHRYATSGTFTARVTVTDAGGCSTRQIYTGQSTICPGSSLARRTAQVVIPSKPVSPPPAASDPAPTLGLLTLGRVRLKAGQANTFRYSLSEPAKVTLTIERRLRGRRVDGRCRPPTRRNRDHRKCVRFRRAGAVTVDAQAGINTTEFSGRLRGRALRPGRYRVSAVATNASGTSAPTPTVAFRVRPRARD